MDKNEIGVIPAKMGTEIHFKRDKMRMRCDTSSGMRIEFVIPVLIAIPK